MSADIETLFPRPLSGAAVDSPPSGLVPARSRLEGRHVQLEPTDPALHAKDLYHASHTSDEARRIWTYLPEGPCASRASSTIT